MTITDVIIVIVEKDESTSVIDTLLSTINKFAIYINRIVIVMLIPNETVNLVEEFKSSVFGYNIKVIKYPGIIKINNKLSRNLINTMGNISKERIIIFITTHAEKMISSSLEIKIFKTKLNSNDHDIF